jgi:hypothetical protein
MLSANVVAVDMHRLSEEGGGNVHTIVMLQILGLFEKNNNGTE